MKKSQLHGKRVTCKIDGAEIADARLSVIKDHVYICQNDVLTPCQIADDEFGYKYCSELANEEDMKIAESLSDFNYWYVTDLKFVETRGRKKKTAAGGKMLDDIDKDFVPMFDLSALLKPAPENNCLELTKENKEQVILILLEEGYKVWEKEGLLYFEREK